MQSAGEPKTHVKPTLDFSDMDAVIEMIDQKIAELHVAREAF